mgnify:CR=1 FL=1
MSNNIIPIILCGGSGSRLWPLSRQSFPKQFLSLNNNKNSLLQNTQLRLKNLKNKSNPILICNEEHRFIVAEQMREINVKPSSIILEPFGKNTAPAITLASLKAIEKNDNDPILLILSSDHQIKDEEKFIEVINCGIQYANKGSLVTFGIVPKSPQTGYGYIEAENEFANKTIPRPHYWSGFRVKPSSFEFWEEMPHRLHKRIFYQQDDHGNWKDSLLFP